MLLISHRGNLYGPEPKKENKPDFIDEALNLHYPVEIDLWVDGKIAYLGHDKPETRIHPSWLRSRSHDLWIHCKNGAALAFVSRDSSLGLHYFYHNKDTYTITSRGYIWCYPGAASAGYRAIAVQPERVWSLEQVLELKNFYGICSDYVGKLDETTE
jgi:hypothetical protein